MHTPVMLNEVIQYLNIKPGSKIVDATLNGGGHALGILEKHPDVRILGIEYDPDIFQKFQSVIRPPAGEAGNTKFGNRIISVNDSYVNIRKILKENNFEPDGIIFDLGLSSFHYESGRGFSFMRDELLDMRFNPNFGKPASEIVNTYPESELERIFREYGEEEFSAGIARAIIKARKEKPILTTGYLVQIINYNVPGWYRNRKIHPATKTFQALRIEANQELENVKSGISEAFEALTAGGRLVVISFQGIEDKIVKIFFKDMVKKGRAEWVKKGTIKPEWEEVKNNPRARSAKMKIIEKL